MTFWSCPQCGATPGISGYCTCQSGKEQATNIDKEREELLRLAQFLKDRQSWLGSSKDYCHREELSAWDDYEKAWTALERFAALDEQKAGPSPSDIKQLWVEVRHQEARAETEHVLAFARDLLSKYGAPAPKGEPVAVLRYERNTPGRENEMPRVVACDWLPDGEYPVYAAPVNERDAKDARDAAFETVRKRLCKLQRYSFVTGQGGGIRRVKDECGSWIEFNAAHELFDPVAVDSAIAQQGKEE